LHVSKAFGLGKDPNDPSLMQSFILEEIFGYRYRVSEAKVYTLPVASRVNSIR
jgi:hypothetical protein